MYEDPFHLNNLAVQQENSKIICHEIKNKSKRGIKEEKKRAALDGSIGKVVLYHKRKLKRSSVKRHSFPVW